MRQVVIPHQATPRIETVASPKQEEREVESSLDRFREQSFFIEECLDLLAALRADPLSRASFGHSGYRHAWLEDIMHQREILERMRDVLVTWETVEDASADHPQCSCQ